MSRTWSDPNAAAYVPPVTLPPLVRDTRIMLQVNRRKPSRANPSGSIASVEWLWPDLTEQLGEPHVPTVPPSAATLVRALLTAQNGNEREPEIFVRYARGFDINGKGENVRKPIWSIRERTPEDPTPPARKDGKPPSSTIREQVGERDPEPVDSVTVAGIWWHPMHAGRCIAFAEAWFLDGAPEGYKFWTADSGAEHFPKGSSKAFNERLKTLTTPRGGE